MLTHLHLLEIYIYIYIAPILKFAISCSSVVSVMFCSDYYPIGTGIKCPVGAKKEWNLNEVCIRKVI